MRRGIGVAVFLLAAPLLTGQELAGQRSDMQLEAPAVVFDYDVPPKLLTQTRPKYPKGAFRKKIEGTVVVEFILDEQGRVGLARVLKSVPELDRSAVETVRAWRFAPAMWRGVPVRVTAQAPVSFCIEGPCATPKQ